MFNGVTEGRKSQKVNTFKVDKLCTYANKWEFRQRVIKQQIWWQKPNEF
jgi:hypothetical protein